MSFQVNVPPSVVAKLAKTEEEVSNDGTEEMATKKREDWKKLKELEEARKAGTAPAMQDEEGKDINPHIPQYIMQAPWYFGAMQPTLKHQRPQEAKKPMSSLDQWYNKGVKEGPVATKFRKGACENCGAMTHKKKDCLERPRKIGAKFTGDDIAPDEHLQPQLDFDFDGKRDRWNGYNPEEHKKVIEDYNKMEEAKRELRAQKMETLDEDEIEKAELAKVRDSDAEEDEDRYADDVDMPGQKFESKQRITVRNLRIREDTAKYLFNLDVNSAYYDPKTRSMRQNPFSNQGKDLQETSFAGDNFVRWSGDALNMAKRQVFAWEAYEKGTEVHLQADPTKLEMLNKEYNRKKEIYKVSAKDSILEKYGGQEHLEAPSKQLLLAQSENYVEYSRHGTIIKGAEKAKIKSRYEEDVYINNHTSVWGSYWHEGQWGYKCCHSFIKESYCTGMAGKEAAKTSMLMGQTSLQNAGGDKTVAIRDADKTVAIRESDKTVVEDNVAEQPKKETTGRFRFFASAPVIEKKEPEVEKIKKKEKSKKKKKDKKKKKKHSKKKKRKSSSSSSSASESESDDEDEARERRIKEAMKKEDIRVKKVNKILAMDERKRPYNSMCDVSEPTEEEIEAFRRKQYRYDDPMAHFSANRF